MDSFYSLFQKIRERPGMFLGRKSLRVFMDFWNGYTFGYEIGTWEKETGQNYFDKVEKEVHSITKEAQLWLDFRSQLDEFIYSHYNATVGSTTGMCLISRSIMDDEDAFDKYCELLDAFVMLSNYDPQKIKLSEENISEGDKFFNELLKGIPKGNVSVYWAGWMYGDKHVHLCIDERADVCKPFILECQSFIEQAMKYEKKFPALVDKVKKEIVTEAYSMGDDRLHRGYYCPSLLIDVLGSGRRGERVECISSEEKFVCKYGFDAQNNIIYSDPGGQYEEIIIRENEQEIGIIFSVRSDRLTIWGISECLYQNDHLVSYTYCKYFPYDLKAYCYTKEEYVYFDESLSTIHRYEFINDRAVLLTELPKDSALLIHKEYKLKYDVSGCLSQYAIIDHPGSSRRKEPVWDGCVYSIYGKTRT